MFGNDTYTPGFGNAVPKIIEIGEDRKFAVVGQRVSKRDAKRWTAVTGRDYQRLRAAAKTAELGYTSRGWFGENHNLFDLSFRGTREIESGPRYER